MPSLIVMCALYGSSFLYCFGLIQSVFSFKIHVVRFWYSFFTFCFRLLSSEWLEFANTFLQFPAISLCFCFSIILLIFPEFMKTFSTLYIQGAFCFCFFIWCMFLRFTQLLARQNWIQLLWFELLWLWYMYCPKFGWHLKQISRRPLLSLLWLT